MMFSKEKEPSLDFLIPSLKANKNPFHSIIKKYSKPVKRIDVIDMDTFSIVQNGGYLSYARPRPSPLTDLICSKGRGEKLSDYKIEKEIKKAIILKNAKKPTKKSSKNISLPKKIKEKIPFDPLLEKSPNYLNFAHSLPVSSNDKCSTPLKKGKKLSYCSHLASTTVSVHKKTPISSNKTKNMNNKTLSVSSDHLKDKKSYRNKAANLSTPSLNNSIELCNNFDHIVSKKNRKSKKSSLSSQNSSQDSDTELTSTTPRRNFTALKMHCSPKVAELLKNEKLDDLSLNNDSFNSFNLSVSKKNRIDKSQNYSELLISNKSSRSNEKVSSYSSPIRSCASMNMHCSPKVAQHLKNIQVDDLLFV